ncbi:E3 ubiquitin-protein ligase [Aspergillus stella-maris]|uniref:E3 ubiquitin-protein ligase n=1 Tax=Aspergillus stella-maris TaxID=1810926 RepID=UPI003CCE47D3
MRKFVRYLGGEKGSSNYHSIWAVPAPESGSRAVATRREPKNADEETLSTQKSTSKLHISKLNQDQPAIAELSSPTTSTFSTTGTAGTVRSGSGPESIAELSASSDAQVSELDGDVWGPIRRRGPRIHTGVRTDEVERMEDEEEVELVRRQMLTFDSPTAATPKPKAKQKPERDPDRDLLIFDDDMDTIPVFGRQFGIAPTSIVREAKKEPEPEPETELESKPLPEPSRESGPKSPEAIFQQVDEELEALYTDYLKSSGKKRTSTTESSKKVKRWKPKPKVKTKTVDKPAACIICLEPFAPDGVRAPDTLSIACQHTPSVCYICLAKSIKHDLETKFWDEIKCPECNTLFIHDDVKRFADEETFNRYDKLSLRHALTTDKNFIWCLDCDFGQLHEPGAEQPHVRCLNCAAESCFKHAIKWHNEFTCDEYDAVLWDPDSYRSIKAKNAGSATEWPEFLSKTKMAKAKKKEQARQEKLHESLKKAARKKQEEEAARIREEKKAQAKADAEAAAAAEASRVQEAETIEEEESEASAEDIKDDFKEKIDMLKKRMREVELSMKMVEETTKRCPGCQWPIEKNEGCDHMTCKTLFLSFFPTL